MNNEQTAIKKVDNLIKVGRQNIIKYQLCHKFIKYSQIYMNSHLDKIKLLFKLYHLNFSIIIEIFFIQFLKA